MRAIPIFFVLLVLFVVIALRHVWGRPGADGLLDALVVGRSMLDGRERSRPGADGLLDALVVGRSTLDGLVCRSGRNHARGRKPLPLFLSAL